MYTEIVKAKFSIFSSLYELLIKVPALGFVRSDRKVILLHWDILSAAMTMVTTAS